MKKVTGANTCQVILDSVADRVRTNIQRLALVVRHGLITADAFG
jgi:hypothetical protein